MPRGRPTKFDPSITAKVLEAVENGATLSAAAVAAGIGRTSIQRWLNRGLRTGEADQPYREFRAGHMRAVAIARKTLEQCVYMAAKTDPDMALKVLERRYPETWSQNKNRIRRLEKLVDDLMRERAAMGQPARGE